MKKKVKSSSPKPKTPKIIVNEQSLAKFPADNPNPVLRVSNTGLLLYANKASHSILKSWKITVCKAVPVRLNLIIKKAFDKAKNMVVEININKDTYEFMIVPMAKTNYINLYAQRITKRKRTEYALSESEKKYKGLFKSAPAAIFEVNFQKQKFISVNYQMCQLSGYSQKELLQMNFIKLFAEKDQKSLRERISKWLSGKMPTENVEYKIISKDGRIIYADLEIAFKSMSKSQQVGATIIAHDITERKKKENELYKLNRTLNALSNSSKMMMHATDEAKYLKDVCRVIVEDCGYALVWIGFVAEHLDNSVSPVAYSGFEKGCLEALKITWADTERVQGPIGTAIRTGKPQMCSNLLTDPKFLTWRAEAKKRGYASTLVLPLVRAAKVFGLLTIYSNEPNSFTDNEINLLNELAEDLAFGIENLRLRVEQTKAQELLRRDKATVEKLAREKSAELIKTQLELERSKRLSDIGFLASTVAHELRNPLAAIAMAVANIKRKAQSIDLTSNLTTITKKIAESDQIINNLLFYTKLRPPKYEKINLYNIIQECIINAEKHYQNKLKISSQISLLQNMLIDADPLQLQEVFSNLLNNAFDAVDPKIGQIELSAQLDQNYIRIILKDNGSGISKDDLEKIFDPFFTTKAKGTGLGLTICGQILKLHGGHIEIKSNLNQGTMLTLFLPT